VWVQTPEGATFFSFFFFILALFMYLSYPLWKKKGFDLNNIIFVGIYFLNNAKIYSKHDTRYFSKFNKIKTTR
jgi:hypothetical protein